MSANVGGAVLDSAKSGMSFEGFLTAYDGQHAEWVDGGVVRMSPPSDRHQDVVGFLHAVLRPFVGRQHGVVRAAPYVMRIDGAAREPDLLAVTAEHRGRITETLLDGPADLVIEVLSPESRARDREQKFHEYEVAGVHEYWLVDPIGKSVEQYRRDAAGWFDRVLDDPTRLVSERFPGLCLEVAWLWSEPLPDVLDVFRTWGLI